MMYYMNSKTFNTFLDSESDNDILHSQYVIISSRIRIKKSKDNIIQAKNILFPDANVCSKLTDDDMELAYYKQLDMNRAFLAALIKGSIEEGYNIIFLCTKNESKIKFLEYLSNYIYLNFGYPVYEYEKYLTGISKLIKYNKHKVLKKCDKEIKHAKTKAEDRAKKSSNGRKELMKEYAQMSKKELKKILKKKSLYYDGMDKSEMLEMIETFM